MYWKGIFYYVKDVSTKTWTRARISISTTINDLKLKNNDDL